MIDISVMKNLRTLLLLFACVALSVAELEDVNQQKRGVNKGPSLNTIPISPKPEQFTYYQQPPPPPPPQQLGPVYAPNSNSFYPNVQPPILNPHVYQQQEAPIYQHQQINPVAEQHLVPYQYAQPNPTYQRIQIIPLKTAGQLQISVIPQQSYQQPYANSQYTTLPTPAQYTVPQSQPIYHQQPFQYAPPYVGQSSQFLMFPQPHIQPAYQFGNPFIAQTLLNYFQTNPAAKQRLLFGTNFASQFQSHDFDKSIVNPNPAKEDNEISASGNDYSAAETTNHFKSTFDNNVKSSYSP